MDYYNMYDMLGLFEMHELEDDLNRENGIKIG